MRVFRKYILQGVLCFVTLTGASQEVTQDWRQKRPAIEIRKVPDSVIEKMKKDPDFRYANDSSYWQQEPQDEPGGFSKLINTIARSEFLKMLLYILLAVGIIFAIYQVMIANNFFIISPTKRNKAGVAAGTDDLTFEDFDERIREEIDKENYRLAVRYMFLKTLKLLSENNFITLHAKSTNQDYIRQMNNHHAIGQFRQLTRIYEYVWYGEFAPNDSQFEAIRTNFNQFNPRR